MGWSIAQQTQLLLSTDPTQASAAAVLLRHTARSARIASTICRGIWIPQTFPKKKNTTLATALA